MGPLRRCRYMLIPRVVLGWGCLDGDRVASPLLDGKHYPAGGDDSDQADQSVQHDRGHRRRGRDSSGDQSEDQGGLDHTDPARDQGQP